MVSGRRRSVIFFTVLGICLVALAVTLNVSWVLLNWRRGVLAVLGVIFFLLIIASMVLNTIFLVREIRRNEQHDSFLNAVTHELRTPIASIRLYLETLQSREVAEEKRQDREPRGDRTEKRERRIVPQEDEDTAHRAQRSGRQFHEGDDRHQQWHHSGERALREMPR